MRPGAASTSSMEHSSGSDFINQHFIIVLLGSGFPRCRWALLPNPGYNRVVAYRSHQARPAAQRGAGTLTTVTLGPQPKEAIGSENMDPVVHLRKPRPVLEQFFLLCNRSIDLRL